jgi:IS5 family transposase
LFRLNTLIDRSIFLAPLSTLRRVRNLSQGGRPAFDSVLMFKVLILKILYNLSDENTELFIRDRLSFREFLGLTLADKVPDARAIWNFGEILKEQDMERHLFDLFYDTLIRQGLEVKGGGAMDGTFVDVPKRHNSHTENEQLKQGMIPERFSSDPHVGSHQDMDARWAKENEETHFCCKNYMFADTNTKLILDYEVTHAAVHGSVPCLDLALPEPRCPGEEIYLDSAYVGSESNPIPEDLIEHGFSPQICEKGEFAIIR